MTNIKKNQIGFIFDLDGTLINTTEIGKIIEKEILLYFNIELDKKLKEKIDNHVFEILQQENRKRLGRKILVAIFKILGLSFKQRIKALTISSRVFKEEIQKIKLYDGVKELFEFLDDNDYSYAIATTSSSKEVDDRLKRFPDFYHKFTNRIVSRSDVKNLKPHSESIEKAANLMGSISLSKCVMVGDMDNDINLGKGVGAITIGVLTGIFSKEMLHKLKPDFIIDSVAQIPNIIENIKEKFKETPN